MADENENTTPEGSEGETPEPSDQADASTPETPQDDAGDQPEPSADAGDDADAEAPGADEAAPEAAAEAGEGEGGDDVDPLEAAAAAAAETPPPTDDESAALAAAMAAINQVQGVADSASAPAEAPVASDAADGATPFMSPEFSGAPQSASKQGIDMLSDVHMNVRIELGRTKMFVEDVLKLSDGAVVELDKLAGDPVDVFVNDRRVARGEVLVLNDFFCVRINEIVDIAAATDD